MSKEYFNKEKQEYENVDIPEDLDFLVRKTLKEGKRRKNHKTISKWSTAVASVTITFILLVNLFPKVAYAASLIPGLDRLVKLVTWDKGFDNAVKDGLTMPINFSAEKDGVTFKVDGLAGDWKQMWVNLSITDGTDNMHFDNGVPKYDVHIDAILPKEYEYEGLNSISYGGLSKDGESVVELKFAKFVPKFTLKFKLYSHSGDINNIKNERVDTNYLAVYEIPITLDPELFNSPLKDVAIDNNTIKTSVGNIIIENIKSSKTRITMTYKLNSDTYDIMGFEKPRLVDDRGNVYGSSYSFQNMDGSNIDIEFQGAVNEKAKSLKFECDGVYYARKDNREIVINLKNWTIEPNDYGLILPTDDGEAPFKENMLIIRGEKKDLFGLKEIIKENENPILEYNGETGSGNEKEGLFTQAYFRILNEDAEKVTLRLYSVIKDKTEPVSVKLIK